MAKSPKLVIGAVLLLCFCLVAVGEALLPSPHQGDDNRQLEDSTRLKLQRTRVGSRKMGTQDNKDDGGRIGVVNWVMDTWQQYMPTSGELEEAITRRQLGSASYGALVPKGPTCKLYGSCVYSEPRPRPRPCSAYERCHPPHD